MKVSLYEAGGRLEGGYSIPGMTLTGPLLLSGNVTSPTEAIHKQYVDTAVTNLDASKFVSGTIANARLPGLTGDIISNPGSNVVSLGNSGVTAGDYTKVVVDLKGRVSSGLSLTEADLPNFNWSKITTNKPTTITGYGITDAVSTQNSVLTGALTLSGAPTQANHAATKAYADTNVANGAKIITGDIIEQSSPITPTGFLRCNGGIVSRTTYSALYAMAGETFIGNVIQSGNGRPWNQQYQINDTQSANISGWTTGTSLPVGVGYSHVVVTKNRVYLLGGSTPTGTISTTQTASINSDGTLGSWTTGTALPESLNMGTIIVVNNRVHLLTANNNKIYSAPINTDGTLGSWAVGSTFPVTVNRSQSILIKGRIYVLGGVVSGTASPVVYTAPVNTDGTLGSWTTTTSLPVGVFSHQVISTKNRIYVLGGTVNSTASSGVYTASVNTDGTLGPWTTATSLPIPANDPQFVVTKNRIYMLGGQNTAYVSNAYNAPINTDGTIGTWANGTALPGGLSRSQAIVTSSRVFLLGGADGTGYTSAVYTAAISGGMNDYSAYYDGTITTTDDSNFRLPDYTLYESVSRYFYIKS